MNCESISILNGLCFRSLPLAYDGARRHALQPAGGCQQFLNLCSASSSMIFVVIVPILTMRVIAEERKQKPTSFFYSPSITTTQVVLGKYIALLAVYLIPLCIISLYPLIFSRFGDVYLPTSYGSILALLYNGQRFDCPPWRVYFFFDGKPGICGRHRNCGYSAELL